MNHFSSTVSRKFTKVGENTLCAEVSDLGKAFQVCRIWPDSCDVGFYLVNSKTGNMTEWVETFRHCSPEDGEWWSSKFEPTKRTIRDNPQSKGWTVWIYND
jgi:hypothetical protein